MIERENEREGDAEAERGREGGCEREIETGREGGLEPKRGTVKEREGGGGNFSKECGLLPTFYPCTVFSKPRPLPVGALSRRWPADDCIVYYRTGGVKRDNSIVYNFYAPAARWTVHAKIDS